VAKKYLGGFWVIEPRIWTPQSSNAKLGSKARQSRIEVRPFQEAPHRGSWAQLGVEPAAPVHSQPAEGCSAPGR
jgi:hypothetical protein